MTPEQTIYLQIEALLDQHRRAGVGEATIATAISRAAAGSQALMELAARLGAPGGRRR